VWAKSFSAKSFRRTCLERGGVESRTERPHHHGRKDYRNDAKKTGSRLLVRAHDTPHQRDAPGAVVTVVCGGKRYVRVADPAFSYLSSNDARAHFGIPGATRADRIEVRWPDGSREVFPAAALNQSIVLKKGQGKPTTTH